MVIFEKISILCSGDSFQESLFLVLESSCSQDTDLEWTEVTHEVPLRKLQDYSFLIYVYIPRAWDSKNNAFCESHVRPSVWTFYQALAIGQMLLKFDVGDCH
jgi:hypothetical protein